MPKAVIIDIDGTLANVTHRAHHVRNGKHDWDAFFEAMSEDTPFNTVIDVIERVLAHDPNMVPFVCTGRPEKYRSDTTVWMRDCAPGVFYPVTEGAGAILMRSDNDHRSDIEVKREMLNNIRAQGFDVVYCFDDRDSVVKMWRDEGITCFQTAPGDWESKPAVTPGTLHLMVGPCAAGKSTFVTKDWFCPETKNSAWLPSSIVSSDALRAEINNGDIRDQSKNQQVFSGLRAIVKTRLEHGFDTIVDATNLRNRDRRTLRDAAPRTSRIVYHVIDRHLSDKVRDAGWRADVEIRGKPLVEFTHNIFQSNLKDILAGDGDQRVDVIDHRPEDIK